MQRHLRIPALGLTVSLLLALATAALGLAHRVPSVRAEAAQALALAGIDICGALPDAHPGDCPVCHLTGALPMPAPDAAPRAAGLRIAVLAAPRESRIVRPVRDPALGLRAPPFA